MTSITKEVVSPALAAANGQTAFVRAQTVKTPMILALVALGALSLAFVWYLVAFLRNRAQQRERPGDSEEGSNPILEPSAEKQLLMWVRRGSRGPFAAAKQSHSPGLFGPSESGHTRTEKRLDYPMTPPCFVRRSLVPNLAQIRVAPPRVHTSQPPQFCVVNGVKPQFFGPSRAIVSVPQLTRPPWRFCPSGPPTPATRSAPGGGYRPPLCASTPDPRAPAPVFLFELIAHRHVNRGTRMRNKDMEIRGPIVEVPEPF